MHKNLSEYMEMAMHFFYCKPTEKSVFIPIILMVGGNPSLHGGVK